MQKCTALGREFTRGDFPISVHQIPRTYIEIPFYKTLLNCQNGGFHARDHAHLAEDRVQMLFHSFGTNSKA